LYPTARVITLIPIFIFPWFVSIPAVLWLGFWFLQQYISGLGSLSQQAATGGVAYWAHVGGFLFGMVIGIAARFTIPEAPGSGPGTTAARPRPFYYGYDRDWPFS
jgi:membrane associated rhomboid family serine protease